MTEPTVFLSFDQALDGQPVPDLDGAQSLIATAHTVQSLFDHQRDIPSEEFIMHLEATLFPNVVIPSDPLVIPSEAEGPPAAAVSRPRPAPRPAPIHPERTRGSHRWIAVAVVLLLLLSGAGAVVYGPFQPRPTPEPSAVPAVSFGAGEASPSPSRQLWKIDSPPGTNGTIGPGIIANDVMFRTFFTGPMAPIQAVDLRTGDVLWSKSPRVSEDLLTGAGDALLIAGWSGSQYELVALDARTGDERWSKELDQQPVGLFVESNRIYLLGRSNVLDVFDLGTQERQWRADLSQFVDDGGESNVNAVSGFAGDRIGVLEGIVAVIVGNGRLVALDTVDGNVQWWNPRRTNGWTRLAVVDGKFVVTAYGSDSLTNDPNAASPITVPTLPPGADPCQPAIQPRMGSDVIEVSDRGETVDSFDPTTGESPWGVAMAEAFLVWPMGESRFIVQIGPDWEATQANHGVPFNCLIDGSTGAVSETTAQEFVTVVIPKTETESIWGVATTPNGFHIWVENVAPELARLLPRIDLDIEAIGRIRGVRLSNGLILITGQDSSLIGFPDGSHNWSSSKATPDVAGNESADTGWTVPAPAGTHAESQDTSPVVVNGRIFRSFYTATADYRTQAVDMMTGAVLWDRPLDVRGEVMASAGDRLLVGGQVGALLKDFALVALDQTSGNEIWRIELSGLPKAIITDGDRAFVLSVDNKLDAVDLQRGTSIYATDIGGESKPVDPARATGSQHRMVIDGKMLVVVLADGSVTGVDLESGEGRWWNLREWTGAVWVDSIAGALIVNDFGDTSSYLSEESRSASGIATLVAVATPMTATCLGGTPTGSPVATPESGSAPNFRTTLTRIDPETGAVRWSVKDPGTFMSLLTSDTDLTYLVSTAAEWPVDRSQIAICAIDLQTGRSSEVESLSGVIDSTFLLTMTDRPEWILVAGRLDSGELGAFPAIFDPTVSGPKITIDPETHGGISWMGIYDNAIYLSRMDGQLEKIPIPAR